MFVQTCAVFTTFLESPRACAGPTSPTASDRIPPKFRRKVAACCISRSLPTVRPAQLGVGRPPVFGKSSRIFPVNNGLHS